MHMKKNCFFQEQQTFLSSGKHFMHIQDENKLSMNTSIGSARQVARDERHEIWTTTGKIGYVNAQRTWYLPYTRHRTYQSNRTGLCIYTSRTTKQTPHILRVFTAGREFEKHVLRSLLSAQDLLNKPDVTVTTLQKTASRL